MVWQKAEKLVETVFPGFFFFSRQNYFSKSETPAAFSLSLLNWNKFYQSFSPTEDADADFNEKTYFQNSFLRSGKKVLRH